MSTLAILLASMTLGTGVPLRGVRLWAPEGSDVGPFIGAHGRIIPHTLRDPATGVELTVTVESNWNGIIDPAFLDALSTSYGGQVERSIVCLKGRPAAKVLVRSPDGTTTIEYCFESGTAEQACARYRFGRRNAEQTRRLIEKVEDVSNRFARVLESKRLVPPGHLAFMDLPVPGEWVVVGRDGTRTPLRPWKDGFARVTAAGAMMALKDSGSKYVRAGLLQVVEAPSGDLTHDVVFNDQLDRILIPVSGRILHTRTTMTRLADAPARQFTFESRATDGRTLQNRGYLITDELGYNWLILYSVTADLVAPLDQLLGELELPSR